MQSISKLLSTDGGNGDEHEKTFGPSGKGVCEEIKAGVRESEREVARQLSPTDQIMHEERENKGRGWRMTLLN
ncbi:hypothetical protein H6P81_001227 [Aristolochia fimbriata]|uniref:Uncharacterized protein n=1 Tax=Aristolochia fimbriata TaxID=158543 RepID=A0AAV7F6Y4_ARIFI|nr:hypothetical protein H6P81_001227 [Aristolochia fimbriata]